MREILFRGKRVDNGEWVYGSLLNPYRKKPLIAHYENGQEILGYTVEVIPDTIGPHTGLKDRNGNKIFEGDILQVTQHGETGVKICAVYFGKYIDADSAFDDYSCIGYYLKVGDECCSIGVLLDSDLESEIIGNIHDNPELLEGE